VISFAPCELLVAAGIETDKSWVDKAGMVEIVAQNSRPQIFWADGILTDMGRVCKEGPNATIEVQEGSQDSMAVCHSDTAIRRPKIKLLPLLERLPAPSQLRSTCRSCFGPQ
jgi:hypothetical protein